jgi:hypothetical protein
LQSITRASSDTDIGHDADKRESQNKKENLSEITDGHSSVRPYPILDFIRVDPRNSRAAD